MPVSNYRFFSKDARIIEFDEFTAKNLGNGIQAGGIKTYRKFQVELKQIKFSTWMLIGSINSLKDNF